MSRGLTIMSSIMCPHGGQAVLASTNTHSSADGSFVLLESDIHTVTGCPFTVGQKYSPCVRLEWSAGSAKAFVNDKAIVIETSIGQCYNAEGAVQGVATIVNTQQKAWAQ